MMNWKTTQWSLVVAAGANNSEAWTVLLKNYEQPIRLMIKCCLINSPMSVNDVYQDFLIFLMEKQKLLVADPTRGSFRGFIGACARNFVQNELSKGNTIKRGGKAKTYSISRAEQSDFELIDRSPDSAEDLINRRWKQSLIQNAHDAILAETAADKEEMTRVYLDHLMEVNECLSKAQIIEQFGVSDNQFRQTLHVLRTKLRQQINHEIKQTVSSQEEFNEEYDDLFN